MNNWSPIALILFGVVLGILVAWLYRNFIAGSVATITTPRSTVGGTTTTVAAPLPAADARLANGNGTTWNGNGTRVATAY